MICQSQKGEWNGPNYTWIAAWSWPTKEWRARGESACWVTTETSEATKKRLARAIFNEFEQCTSDNRIPDQAKGSDTVLLKLWWRRKRLFLRAPDWVPVSQNCQLVKLAKPSKKVTSAPKHVLYRDNLPRVSSQIPDPEKGDFSYLLQNPHQGHAGGFSISDSIYGVWRSGR